MEKLDPGAIIAAAVRVTEFSRDCLTGQRRSKEIIEARFALVLAIADLRQDYSLQKIGHLVGKRDHTTIRHAILRARSFARQRPEFAALVETIKREALSRPKQRALTALDLSLATPPAKKPEIQPAAKVKPPSAKPMSAQEWAGKTFADYGRIQKAESREADEQLKAIFKAA
jgi:hypothetical protein